MKNWKEKPTKWLDKSFRQPMDDKTYRSEALSPPCCIEWYSWVSRLSAPSYPHDLQPQRGTCFLCHLNVCSNGHDLGVGGTVKKLFANLDTNLRYIIHTYIKINIHIYIYVWQLILSAQTAPSWIHAYYAWKINMTDRSRTKISTSALTSSTPAAPCTRRRNHMHKNDNGFCRKPRQSKVKPEQPGHSHCQFSKAPAHHWIIYPLHLSLIALILHAPSTMR